MQYQASEGKSHILFIEDESSVAEAIKECLSAAGFEITHLPNIKEAFSLLSTATPDLILSDINLPDITGFDFFKQIKGNPLWSTIPFLFLSGESEEGLVRQVLGAGGDYFIKKPIDVEELISVIQGKLHNNKIQEETTDQRLEAFKKRVVHTLSHEFRTPLVSITTGSELLLEEYDSLDDEQVRNLITSIYRGGQRLERLVEDFMTVQQIDAGQTGASFEQFKAPISLDLFLARLKEEVDSRLSPLFKNPKLQISIDENLKSQMIEFCTPQMLDVFVRLVDNAFKFTGGEDKVAELSVQIEDDKVIFSVRDYGKGLVSDHVEELRKARPFTQIKREIHEQQGCGLGLSIATHYVSLHGGHLNLDRPTEGPGMVVIVEIPLKE